MGNTPSSETPRRATQKLSKPRTNQRASTVEPVATTQYANAYHVGHPLSGVPPSPSSRALERTYTGLSEAPSERIMSPIDGSKERERRLSGIVRSNTYKQDYTPRHSMVAASVHSVEQRSISRTNSMVYGPGTRSLTGEYAASLPAQSRCGSFHYDLPVPEPRSPMFPDMMIPQVPPLPTRLIGTESVEGPDASPRSPVMQQAASAAITRNNSEASLYPPLRRRSIVQTPGVATRSPAPLTNRSSFRRSLPPSPSVSRQSSVDAKARRHSLIPPQPRTIEPESRERVVTPCEEEYKQLGGMKFGSLRIVNGSPGPAQASDRAKKQAQAAEDDSSLVRATADDEARHPAKLKIVQPKPTSPVASPVVASFDQVSWSDQDRHPTVKSSGNDLSGASANATRHSSLSTPSPSSPCLEVASKRTEYEDGLFEIESSVDAEAIKPEIINVKEVPLARPNDTPADRGDARKQTTTVSRSDSGFASTSSSTASGKPLSKTDSGYGSSLSLRSLRRSQSRARSPKKKAPEPGNQYQSPEDTQAGPILLAESPIEPVSTTTNDEPLRSSGRGFSLLSSSKSIHFSSNGLGLGILRPSKSRDGSTLKRHSSSHRPRSRTSGTQDAPESLMPATSVPDDSSKQPRLQRFWHSSRRKSMPAKYDGRGTHEPMPMTSAHLSGQNFDDALLYPATATLRLEPSKATLKTILSVSSVELHQAQDDVPSSPLPKVDPPTPRPKTSQTMRAHGKAASTATVTVAEKPTPRPSYRHARKSSASSNGVGTATQPQTPRLKSRSSAPSFLEVDPGLPGYALQAHVSRKGSKTPPPLSMRRQNTRSSSRLQQVDQQIHKTWSPNPPDASVGWQSPGIDRFRTHSPIDEADPSTFRSYSYHVPESVQVGGFEASNHYLPQRSYRRGSTGQHTMGSPSLPALQTFVHNGQNIHMASRTRQSWGHPPSRSPAPESMYRTATPNQHYAVDFHPHQLGHAASGGMTTRNRRASLDPRLNGYSQTPPYRILHSYDSPAYRNTPIWN